MAKDIEFNKIISDIIKNDEFIKLKYEDHHGITRLEHSLSVAKVAYKLSSKLSYEKKCENTRAALLHDFFTDEDFTGKYKFFNHPELACENAINHFNINERQINAIKAHMFPTAKVLPKYSTSWIVTLSDKIVAVYELLKYKAPLRVGAHTLLLINLLYLPIYPK